MASQSDTSLEGTPGTSWGLRAGSGSSRPGAGGVPVILRALTGPVRAAPWSDKNFYEKVKSSGFFSPPKKVFSPLVITQRGTCFPPTFSMRHPLPSCLSREGSRAVLGSPAAAGATTGEGAGPSDTTVALLGASRLCPFRCPQQSSARRETTFIQRDRQRLRDQMGDEVSCPLPSHHPWDLGILSPGHSDTVVPHLHCWGNPPSHHPCPQGKG